MLVYVGGVANRGPRVERPGFTSGTALDGPLPGVVVGVVGRTGGVADVAHPVVGIPGHPPYQAAPTVADAQQVAVRVVGVAVGAGGADLMWRCRAVGAAVRVGCQRLR